MVEAPLLNAELSRNPPLRLLALVPKPTGVSPGQRFRLEQWAPLLAARHRISVDFLPFESPGLTAILYKPGHHFEKAARVSFDFARRLAAVLRARRYDAVIVYREAALLGPALYERLLTRLGVPLFFDFDDAIWAEGEAAGPNGVFSKLHFWGKTATICRIATGVFVGNGYLAEYARQHSRHVFVLPTSINLDHYHLQPDLAEDDPFVVVWTGSTHTLRHFEHARAPLERLASMRRVSVKVICNSPPERPIAGASNLFIPWSPDHECEHIGSAHVGIMPLPDELYTRGKCGLKALQYMATGRPAIVSPVGMNKDLVEHGQNGYLAATTDEYVDCLDRLARSRELRSRLGAAGRKTVEEGFSAEIVATSFSRAVRARLAA